MKACCRKFWCCLFCCRCSKTNPLKSIDENTRLIPKNEKTRRVLEKNELHAYGVIPETLRGQIIDITNFTKSFVRKIVCGSNHCLILFNDGKLAAFGSNEEGQLGLELKKEGNYLNEIKNITLQIKDPLTEKHIDRYEIWDIGAGENFSLVLIQSGLKTMVIRLGILPEHKYLDNFENINTVNLVDIDYAKINNIRKIFVFGHRSLLLTANNDLFVGGIDFNLNPIDKYKHLERFGKQIKEVYLGLEHCLILDIEGGLYCIGDNTYGELGVEFSSLDKPTKVNFSFDSDIKKVAVGARHSLILLNNGDLYAFGDNSEGQCTGYNTRYTIPARVDVESKDKIVDVYSGYNHNLVVLSNGDMYSWGDTSSGKLGYVEGNYTQNSPKCLQVLKGKYANYISLGFQMTVISTSSYEISLANRIVC